MDFLKSIFKGDKVVWAIFLFLCLISVLEVFSAASTLTYRSGDHWGPITQHATFLVIGVIVVVLLHNVPYNWFKVIPVLLYPISVAMLVIVMIMGFVTGERVNGAARWMQLFGIQFQPSELAKMAVVILTAFILSKGQSEEGAHPKAFTYILVTAGIVCLLIAPENYSTAALLFATVFLMMLVGRVQTRKLVILAGTLAVVLGLFVAFLVGTSDDTLRGIPGGHRFTTWKDRIVEFVEHEQVPPAEFDIDDKAQEAHARIAVATSHIIGKGPGNSVERDFLSQAFSDFIYAIVIEESGLVGGAFVTLLYIILLVRVGRIARKCDRVFPALLIIGVALLLVTQAMFNMMVAVGLAPITGQPLPLISKGGTSTLINCAYIGMILSVSRYTAKLDEQRAHDAAITMSVSTGQPEEMVEPRPVVPQVVAEPTSEKLNEDSDMV